MIVTVDTKDLGILVYNTADSIKETPMYITIYLSNMTDVMIPHTTIVSVTIKDK